DSRRPSFSRWNLHNEVLKRRAESQGTRKLMKIKKAPIQPRGRFGKYGGQYVPETLMKPLQDLEEAYDEYSRDPSFKKELRNLLGAEVHPVDSGSRTLKDAINESLRDWVTNVENTYYLLGSAVGPHPYPTMVRDFQSIIGREARQQILAREDKLPSAIIACV